MTVTDLDKQSPGNLVRGCLAALTATPGVWGALIATTDGQVAVADMPPGQDAIAAALIGSTTALSQGLSGLLGSAPCDELIVASADGTIVISALGTSHLIAVLGTTALNMAAVRLATRRLVSELVLTLGRS